MLRLLLALIVSTLVGAQSAGAAPIPAARGALPEDRVEAAGMAVLGSWAALNLAGGTAGALLAEDEAWRAFHLGNAAWNTVNGGIAIAGAVSLARREPASGAERVERARRLHRVLAINAGLDVGYLAAGGVLWAVGARQQRPALVGTGAALGLQGAWLLGFDLGLRARHKAVLDELELTPLGLRGRF
jgi:hypothetical protein